MNIAWLGQPECNNLALVGGKVANLSRLAAKYPVPTGFCLTTATFVPAQLTANGYHVPPLPPELLSELDTAYRLLAERTGTAEPDVAVRSSAVDEDGSLASFAGQHETYLNISGLDAVIEAIRHCWESAYSERVIAYRLQRGLDLGSIRLAVLVQQLVRADVASVVFSANPMTGNRAEVVINASWGLGESIVGGTVTPDTYFVDKNTATITTRYIGEKRRMTISMLGGTREVDVPHILRKQPSLNDEQILEMAHLACDLESTMGWPVDIECAYKGNQLFLLQCRPITTLNGNTGAHEQGVQHAQGTTFAQAGAVPDSRKDSASQA